MDAKELRIGNYVYMQWGKLLKQQQGERSEIYQIQNVNLQNAKKYDPIPLTEEWLLKFGLISYQDIKVKDSGFLYIESVKDEKLFYIMGNDNPTYSSMFKLNVKYVHQLQNLYFALTGQELTIKQ